MTANMERREESEGKWVAPHTLHVGQVVKKAVVPGTDVPFEAVMRGSGLGFEVLVGTERSIHAPGDEAVEFEKRDPNNAKKRTKFRLIPD